MQDAEWINTLRFANSTNLHTHGLHISPNSPQDDVLLTLNGGESIVYKYEIIDNHNSGALNHVSLI